MKKHDELLHHATLEIKRLREANKILSAQVHVVEVFAAATGFHRGGSGMLMGGDIAYEIDEYLLRQAEAGGAAE